MLAGATSPAHKILSVTSDPMTIPSPGIAGSPTRFPPAAVTSSVLATIRLCVEAATEEFHGPVWATVPSPGPAFPADADTKIPAAKASRKAWPTESVHGLY